MKLRRWRVICDRNGEVVSRCWTGRGAQDEARHLTVVSSVRFDEAKERLLGEPLTFSARRI